jgi:type IVB pilus formation R64 PilN family outer membrane protein
MKKSLVALLGVSFLLTGCLTDRVEKSIADKRVAGEEGFARSQQPADIKEASPLTVTKDVWTGSQSVQLRSGRPLPSKFEQSRGIALVSANPVELSAIANMVASQTGIPVRLASDVTDGGAGARSSSKKSSSKSSSSSSSKTAPQSGGMTLAYEGSLSGLLDLVSSNFGVLWRYDGSAIVISRYETRVFMVEALPGSQTFSDGIGKPEDQKETSTGSTSGSGGTGTLNQASDMKVDLKFWEELKENISTMIGDAGSFTISPSSGTITVVTTPDNMRTIATYIRRENNRLTRQVAINVEVFALDLNEGEDYGLDMNVVYRKLENWPQLALTGAPTGITDTTGSLGLSVLNLDPSPTGGAREFNKTNTLIQALSTLGNVSRVAQLPITTLNNRPATRRIGRDIGYLASSSTTIGSSSSVSTSSLQPGTVREGFSLQLTPRVLDDGRILLQYSLADITLVQFTTVASNGSSIQVPETVNRLFAQQALMKNGATLVLAGYNQAREEEKHSGIGSPFNFLIGGGMVSSSARQIMFIAITPRELSVPRVEAY